MSKSEKMWLKMHETLRCQDCMFCDSTKHGKGACCTFPGIIRTDDSSGTCECYRLREKY